LLHSDSQAVGKSSKLSKVCRQCFQYRTNPAKKWKKGTSVSHTLHYSITVWTEHCGTGGFVVTTQRQCRPLYSEQSCDNNTVCFVFVPYYAFGSLSMIIGSLSLLRGPKGGTVSNMEGIREYTEQAVANSRQVVVLQLGGWAEWWQVLSVKT